MPNVLKYMLHVIIVQCIMGRKNYGEKKITKRVQLNKELFDLVISSESFHPTSRERRCSRLNNTWGFWRVLDQVTRLVCPSRVLPRMRKLHQVTSSTWRRRVNLNQSRNSLLWLLYKSIQVY